MEFRAEAEDTGEHREYCSCVRSSLYPFRTVDPGAEPTRCGDPIADQIYVDVRERGAVLCLADGCNWGFRPVEAAVRSLEACREHLLPRLREIDNARLAGHTILRCFDLANRKISAEKEDAFEAGTTTLLVALVMPLAEPTAAGERWAFVAGSVGDCKAYFASAKDGAVRDITSGNRGNLSDARDPGGRLGPYLSDAAPDLRNLMLYFAPLSDGDVVMIFSDGVHDNFDPQQMGMLPNAFDIDVEDWVDVDDARALETKEAHRNRLLTEIVASADGDLRKMGDAIMEHCKNITEKGRKFMEEFPDRPQPSSYVEYPGKMDHASFILFRIGERSTL